MTPPRMATRSKDRPLTTESHLLPQHRKMAGRAHEEEKRQRQPGADLRNQERLTAHALRFLGNRRALLREGPGPQDDALLDAPHDAPDVQQKHPANAAANADSQQAVALP